MAVTLSARDIDDISRVVQTEIGAGWRGETLYDGVAAVVDTIINRVQSGHYPGNVRDVLNQSRQFSKITGPSSLQPYGSVQRTPSAAPEIEQLVRDVIADRALGSRSAVAGHINYANPNYSYDKHGNLPEWVAAVMADPYAVTGQGRSMHVHGTAPGFSPLGQEPDIKLTQDAIDFVAPPLPAAKGEEAPVNPIRETLLSTLETGAIPVFDEGPLSRARVTGFGSPYADAARAVPTVPVERSMLADLPSLAPFGTMASPIGSAPVSPVERGSLPDISPADPGSFIGSPEAQPSSRDFPSYTPSFAESYQAMRDANFGLGNMGVGDAPSGFSMPGNVGMMEFAGMPSGSQIGFSATGSGSGSRGATASYDGSIASPISVDATGMGSGSRGASASYSGSVASPVGEVPSSIGQSIMDMGLSPSATATLNERSWAGAPASPVSSPFSGPSITDIGFSGMDLASPFSAVDFPGSMSAVSVPSVSVPATPAPTISAPSVAPSLGVNTPSASGIAAPADKPDKKADDTGSKVGRNVGRAIGGLAGGMMLGPLGAVAGALIGGQIGKRGGSIDLPSLGSLGGIVSPDGWAATPYGQAEAAGRTANGGFSPSGFWSGYAGAGGGDSAESMAIAMSREQDARSNAGMGTFGDMFGGGGSGPSGGGGCFITTAAVEIAGEPDDGDTLQTLRWFRDNVMRKRPDWSADVEAYYRIAPEIVRRLNGDREVYADLMTRFIRPAVAAIKRQDFDGAYSLYRSMVESLA